MRPAARRSGPRSAPSLLDFTERGAILHGVSLTRKLAVLADAAKYDASCASSGSTRQPPARAPGLGSNEAMGICHSYTPDGRCVSLLKLLLTNYCVYDCSYCINRRSSNTPRESFEPEEVVQLTLEFYRRNYIEGLFLSSGVLKNADTTMERMVEVARQLRERHAFTGYIHLKVVPGAARELVERAAQLADRVSCNIELPSAADLARLAPEKRGSEIERVMAELRSVADADPAAGARSPGAASQPWAAQRGAASAFAGFTGQTTQMIVGATPSSDAVVLATSARLYDTYRLKRVYFTTYSPIPDSDALLPARAPSRWREHRLYQADWLMRFYGFTVDEITPPDAPDLSPEHDPKLAWALRHRAHFPIDVNVAPRELLLRIPGVGAQTVKKLLAARQRRALRDADLKKLGVSWRKAAAFVVTADGATAAARQLERLDLAERLRPRSVQLELFAAQETAQTGQL